MTTTDRINTAKTVLLARLEAAGLVLDTSSLHGHGVYAGADGDVTIDLRIRIGADLIEATARALQEAP